MAVPYTFANATTSIPLSQLDSNFATAITIGNTAVYLGNTTTSFGNVTLTNVTISSGNSTVTSQSIGGNLTFTGTGNRITGDFTNATQANKVAFQTSTSNGATVVASIPNGSSTISQWRAYNGADPDNSAFVGIIANGLSQAQIISSITGTGSYLPMTFLTGGSERMRIDSSGNVGIGTSSPVYKLDINGITGWGANQTAPIANIVGANAPTNGGGNLRVLSNTSATADAGGSLVLGGYYTAQTNSIDFAEISGRKQTGQTTGGYLALSTRPDLGNQTERMRIDSSGNVGIGTSSPGARLDVNGGRSFFAANSEPYSIYLRYNGSTSGFYIGSPSADAMQFSSSGGTERMRIDSSGNVGIGTSSPAASLSVVKQTTALSGTGNSYGLYMYPTSSGLTYIDAITGSTGNTSLGFRTYNNGTYNEMRIDSSGNVGIGTTSPAAKFDVVTSASGNLASFRTTAGSGQGLLLGVDTTNLLTYFKNNTSSTYGIAFYSGAGSSESMRIDSSGSLLVGTASKTASETLKVIGAGSASGEVARFENSTNTSGYSCIVSSIQQNGNNTSTWHFRGNTNNVANWYLYGNGTTSYSSDARLKKNIETTRDGYLEDIAKLRVVKYNWRNDEDGTAKELGLIAQEVEQIFPGLVQDDPSKISETDDTTYKQLKGSVLPFILLKCIQELSAKVDALEAKLGTK